MNDLNLSGSKHVYRTYILEVYAMTLTCIKHSMEHSKTGHIYCKDLRPSTSNRLNQYYSDKAYSDVVNLTLWPMGMRMQRWKSLFHSSFPGKLGGCYLGKLGSIWRISIPDASHTTRSLPPAKSHADRILASLATGGFLGVMTWRRLAVFFLQLTRLWFE